MNGAFVNILKFWKLMYVHPSDSKPILYDLLLDNF